MKISARNVFPGTVTAIKAGTVNSEVKLSIADGIAITSVITKDSVKHLVLKKGVAALAIIKSSGVLLATQGGKISARNVLTGVVSKITGGSVNSVVSVTLTGGLEVIAVITKSAVKELGLKKGVETQVIIKASNVLLATE